MVTRERMNEILDLVVGEQELTPELMDMLEEFRTDYFTEEEKEDNTEEIEGLRGEIESRDITIKELKDEIRRRFFDKVVEEATVEDEEKEEETITIKDFSE